MKYSLDFKPRIMIVLPRTKENEKSTRVDLCFYDYFKHHDIRCYDRNGEEISEETVEHIFDLLDKYCPGDAKPTYKIKFENDPEIGDVWICRCIDPSGIACFIGYSESNAAQAIADCECAKGFILYKYHKPKDNKPENVNE